MNPVVWPRSHHSNWHRHGGSPIFSASMLELNAACGGPQNAEILGEDIDIRAHNGEAIEAHPTFRRVSMIQGASISPEVIKQMKATAAGNQRVLVCLDSDHTHDPVLAELQTPRPLTSVGSYCIVFDTIIEDIAAGMFPDRPWGPDNNPKTSGWEYLITVAPDGYLRRVG